MHSVQVGHCWTENSPSSLHYQMHWNMHVCTITWDTMSPHTSPRQQQVWKRERRPALYPCCTSKGCSSRPVTSKSKCVQTSKQVCWLLWTDADTIAALAPSDAAGLCWPGGKMAPKRVHISSWVVCIHPETNWSLISQQWQHWAFQRVSREVTTSLSAFQDSWSWCRLTFRLGHQNMSLEKIGKQAIYQITDPK